MPIVVIPATHNFAKVPRGVNSYNLGRLLQIRLSRSLKARELKFIDPPPPKIMQVALLWRTICLESGGTSAVHPIVAQAQFKTGGAVLKPHGRRKNKNINADISAYL